MGKLWDKGVELNKKIEAFTVGEDSVLDQTLVQFDCQASIAHARMLGKAELLTHVEVDQIVSELKGIMELDLEGKFIISREQEDCHTAIEEHLIEKLGVLGKKIHTARSRNDQVLTALRLYYKDRLENVERLLLNGVDALMHCVEQKGEIEIPGYTHSRKAMPSSIGLWAEAYADSLKEDLSLVQVAKELIDQSPLGTGAGYGIPMQIDREYASQLMGFSKVQENPLYTQISRGKFEITILHALSQILFDLNKLATDLILFTMPEFGFFDLPESFSTGSSIMPHKKNPDVLELLRAKYHVVVSNELQLKSMLANLISGYNRDVQLSKGPVMNSFNATAECLEILSLLIRNLKVNEEACRKSLTEDLFATEKVYKLVQQGVSFRDAYRRVAESLKK